MVPDGIGCSFATTNYAVPMPRDGSRVIIQATLDPEDVVEFPWTNAVYQSVSKALSILKLPEFVVEGDGKEVSIRADDTRNPTGDTFQTKVSDDTKEFLAVFRAENIRFLPKDYQVSFSSKGVARFQADGIKYLVMSEARK